tara:strand:- start:298 stop:480 length:183 start_codon:yes stop_codon:yes gene_type:complete
MALSSHKTDRIYQAATMGYGLGSDDLGELSYYNKIEKEMGDMKQTQSKQGYPFLCVLLEE